MLNVSLNGAKMRAHRPGDGQSAQLQTLDGKESQEAEIA